MASVAVTPGNRPAADLPDLRDCDAYVRLEQVFSLLDEMVSSLSLLRRRCARG